MAVSVLDFEDYKAFCLAHIADLPKSGRGQFRKLALHLRISPVVVSQVLKGDRNFNAEQAVEVADFFGLQTLELKYFVLLVQRERAGTHRLKKLLTTDIEKLRTESLEIKNRIPKGQALSEEGKAEYYSSWHYAGSRLLSDLPGGATAEQLSERFQIPLVKARRVLEFLLQQGLCEEKAGEVTRTSLSTHLESGHPLVARHHQNWRLKGFQQMDSRSGDELYFTGPMVLSEEAAQKIRKELVDAISRVTKLTEESSSETLFCLNLDWFPF